MKKSILVLVMALFGTSLQSAAQQVDIPKWEKFVMVNKDGVNLRKAPNTQSARLMSKTEEVEFMYATTLSWTAKAGAKPFNFPKGTVLPVIDTHGEWYHVYVNVDDMVNSNQMDAYIRHDFCTPIEPVQMQTGGDAPYVGFTIGRPYKLTGNKGLYISYLENDMEGNDAMIGKSYGSGVVWFGYEGFYDYLTSLCSANEYGGITIDMKKITEEKIVQFINAHRFYGCMGISYQFPTGSEEPITNWSYDSNKNLMPFIKFDNPLLIKQE